MNREQAEEYFRKDIWYPITAEGIKEVCDNMTRFSAEEREWVKQHVPPGVYQTPEDAIRAALNQRNHGSENGGFPLGQAQPLTMVP